MTETSADREGPYVMWLGLRGLPGIQGGVETHAQHVLPRLAENGCTVEAVVRSPYMRRSLTATAWRGVRYVRLWAPRSRALEAIVHTLLGVLVAAWRRPDVLHIQAIGPALWTPLARLFGLHVVFTHHGPDYDRQKWGAFARFTLRLGEWAGCRCANETIVISRTIQSMVLNRHGRASTLIPNGVEPPSMPTSSEALSQFNLQPRRYVLIVSRLVPEKRHLDLIEAFVAACLPDWKLVIVGAADHRDAYAERVQAAAQRVQSVVLTGFQSGPTLGELYAHAGLFVLPSSHEGLPIAMLEALSYGLPVIASDIPANLEVGLAGAHYFKLGDVTALAGKLKDFAEREYDAHTARATQDWVTSRFDWSEVASATRAVYSKVLARR